MLNKDFILKILWKYYGDGSSFREGQDKAILAALNNKRTLVVQKTGWGKSLVYFLTTRILRDSGRGPTIVISPLLSLMNNQMNSANKFRLNAQTINSNNKDDWEVIIEEILNDSIDILFISPERLGNKEFVDKVISKIEKSIGMLVVDEAHCISDWGHDFRPDYRRIVNIIKRLPRNVPLIATTATANDRVINDIRTQLGDELLILRGPLTRESISIDIIKLGNQAERLAWLSENLKKLNGTGIIYTLTVDDTKLVANYLREKGYDIESYYGGLTAEERSIKEEKLLNNKIKALVATVALGMGFDKGDLSFVIHYQKPGNVVAYYQQIGRAGRAVANSNAILMCGEEDDEISNYFINSAFPTQDEMIKVVDSIKMNDGIKEKQILSLVNMKSGRLEKCLKYLEVDGAIYKEKNSKYYPTTNNWEPNLEYSHAISEIRRYELKRMNDYIETDQCLMEFIAKELDDTSAKRCGKCMNCRSNDFTNKVNSRDVIDATEFLKGNHMVIEPRKQWPTGIDINTGGKITIAPEHKMEQGIVLCSYGDAGWGKIVREGKYSKEYFGDDLVDASAKVLKQKISEWDIKSVVYVPSLKRPTLVKDFAYRLAMMLRLPCYDAIEKIADTPQQKTLENSYYQCENVIKGFGIKQDLKFLGNTLIIDDMVDSKWTFTYCTYLLKSGYADKVYPFALAKTSGD
jgi:ATP-dependent DNA helicase, RecQ family